MGAAPFCVGNLEMLNTTRSLLRRRILAAANRMMSTHRHAFSFNSHRSPWLVLEPRCAKTDDGAIFNFWCCAERRKYLFHDAKKLSRGRILVGHSDALRMHLLGSSPGWLAFQHHRSDNIFLLDPVSYVAVDLPPWIDNDNHKEVETLVFSDSERKAFAISGSGDSLAFCSTSTRDEEWTPFGGGGGGEYYESMAYSTAHRRLFCITSSLKLEAWDVGHDSPTPRLDWVAHLDGRPDLLDMALTYLACEEQSGQLFLVVRQVRDVDSYSEEDLTVDFKVYRIDQRQRLNLMRDSLEGMAFFVGSNQAIAIRDDGFGLGVEPDSVYFTFDRRLGLYRCSYSFVGNFDYRRRSISPVSCPVGGSPYPVWFTPHPRHIILLP